jgi:hypothetical protein
MKKQTLIEIWGDVVEARSLLYSILIITFTTLGAHLLAPAGDRTLGLFFGLAGAVIGFIIVVALFKPKRIIKDEEDMQ